MTLSTVHQNMLLTGWITTNRELRNTTNQILSYIGFTLYAVDVIVLLTGWPCQQWVLMSYWQGDPVSSGWWCIIDMVTLSVVGVDVLLTGSPCQQWVLMSYWQGHPVSSGVDVLLTMLTGSPCQQWVLMSYLQGHPISSGCWCLIDRVTLSAVGLVSYWPCHVDRVTLSAVGVEVLLTGSPCQQWGWCFIDHVILTGSPCQQWVLMSYWQGHPVSSEVGVLLTMSCWQCHPVSSVCWCNLDRVTLAAEGVYVIGYLVYGWQ